ncbi:MAG: leucine-rich repeat domain-containing protein [Clostridia bacterium]|nr:leucine-rich repeat domain-containing protein [Clostridia bacterium]
MKKIIALFLVVVMACSLFISCNKNKNENTTSNSTPESTTAPSQTSSDSSSGSQSEESTSASTTEKPPLVFEDPQLKDSNDYDYVIRIARDPNTHVITDVAVVFWKNENAASELVFDAEYVLDGVAYPVTQIGFGQGVISGFHDRVESITIPSSVVSIGKKAFSPCNALKTLTLSEGLEKIGEMAFWNCGSLESVSIPSTVQEIGANAFSGCKNLKHVKIPRRFETQIDSIFFGHPADMQIEYID